MKRIRARLTYANVVSTLALFLVLGSGAAFAAKKLTTKDIKKGAIRTKLLAKNAVTSPKLAAKAVKARNIAPDSIDGSKVRNGSLTPADLLGGASIVGSATGGPVDVAQAPTPVPLSGGNWTQGATENDLFLVRMETTLQSAGASSCLMTVTFEVGGVNVGTTTSFGSSEAKTVTTETLLSGARVASGAARPSQLTATATAFGVIEPCKQARIQTLRVLIVGVG
jgi:hypothetical protein